MKPISKFLSVLLFALVLFPINGCSDLDDKLKLVSADDVITKDDALFELIQKTTKSDGTPFEKIVCLDFIYPLTVLIYDDNLVVIGKQTVVGDAEFSTFLGGLPATQAISISYPIQTTLADGSLFTVNSNTELKVALDSCSKEDIIAYGNGLFGGSPTCVWTVPYTKDANNTYAGGVFKTNFDGTLTFLFEGQSYTGTWTFLYVDDIFHMNISLEGSSQVALDWNIDREAEFFNDKIIITNSPKNFVLQQRCEQTDPFAIGDTGPAGGIVFYDKGVYSFGWRYMEISDTDLGIFEWGCSGSNILNSGNTVIGSGLANSAAIASFHDQLADYYTNPSVCNALNNGTVAAQKALHFHVTGHETVDDWFLPSQEELTLAYQNLYTANLGNFTASSYWTSTQTNANMAIAIDFTSGAAVPTPKIPNGNPVKTRAVRYF